MARAPRFLLPAAYRQRRLRDAARLLPVVGSVLFLLPLLWDGGAGVAAYVFGAWAALVAAAAVIGRRLDMADSPAPQDRPRDAP